MRHRREGGVSYAKRKNGGPRARLQVKEGESMSKKEKKQKVGKLARAAKRARMGKATEEECSCGCSTERALVAFDEWKPAPVPAAESATLPPYSSDAAYSCEDDAYAGRKKTITVDFLYLDLTVCDRCQGADKRVERAVELCRPVLAACGYDIVLNSVNVDNEWLAEQYKFYSSPTVRVNDVDICPSIEENDCDCCRDLSDYDVKCRLFPFNGTYYEVPPTDLLVRGIMEVALQGRTKEPGADAPYELPENLAGFFAGKRKKDAEKRAEAGDGEGGCCSGSGSSASSCC